jgi:deazaflavin-dependent oxidoreductase (nitroreductase family)
MALEAEMSGTLFGRASDVVVRKVLRSPLHGLLSQRLLIITVTGRKTGRRYSNPVGYAQHDGALLVGSVAGWRRNLRPGELVPVRLRGADVLAEAEVITDEERAAEFYRVILPVTPCTLATPEFTPTRTDNRTVPTFAAPYPQGLPSSG